MNELKATATTSDRGPLSGDDRTERCVRVPLEGWRLRLSLVAFIAAVLFVAVGLASESAGAHWFVGLMSVAGSLLCVFICLRLHGLTLKHFMPGRGNGDV